MQALRPDRRRGTRRPTTPTTTTAPWRSWRKNRPPKSSARTFSTSRRLAATRTTTHLPQLATSTQKWPSMVSCRNFPSTGTSKWWWVNRSRNMEMPSPWIRATKGECLMPKKGFLGRIVGVRRHVTCLRHVIAFDESFSAKNDSHKQNFIFSTLEHTAKRIYSRKALNCVVSTEIPRKHTAAVVFFITIHPKRDKFSLIQFDHFIGK